MLSLSLVEMLPFQQLQKVISILGDEEKRAFYDQTGCVDDADAGEKRVENILLTVVIPFGDARKATLSRKFKVRTWRSQRMMIKNKETEEDDDKEHNPTKE
ncbi:hypothetical protein Q3G72_013010 [Acer saccharum]|nr:hypothetical protein Q3G72_013010 [Acer saccharum]